VGIVLASLLTRSAPELLLLPVLSSPIEARVSTQVTKQVDFGTQHASVRLLSFLAVSEANGPIEVSKALGGGQIPKGGSLDGFKL
jgi:hypothetical protein